MTWSPRIRWHGRAGTPRRRSSCGSRTASCACASSSAPRPASSRRFKAPPGDATLSLYDLAGRVVQSQRVSATGGEQSVTFHGLAALAPGMYALRFEATGVSLSRRVVRVR